MFYFAIDSVFPNPLTSVNDFLPQSRLDDFLEFACYPGYYSNSQHAVAKKDVDRITQAFEKEMPLLNDINGDNMFTLAIKGKNVRVILEVMKNLSQMAKDKLAAICAKISLLELMKKNNAYVVCFIKNAMVLAISDRGQ